MIPGGPRRVRVVALLRRYRTPPLAALSRCIVSPWRTPIDMGQTTPRTPLNRRWRRTKAPSLRPRSGVERSRSGPRHSSWRASLPCFCCRTSTSRRALSSARWPCFRRSGSVCGVAAPSRAQSRLPFCGVRRCASRSATSTPTVSSVKGDGTSPSSDLVLDVNDLAIHLAKNRLSVADRRRWKGRREG